MTPEPHLNSNMDQRPSNATLLTNAILQCLISGITGAVLMSSVLMFSRGLPFDGVSLFLIGLGVAAGLITFSLTHFRYAKQQKAAYIAAGGNATGINLFMFGAMGGKVIAGGMWQWHNPDTDFSS